MNKLTTGFHASRRLPKDSKEIDGALLAIMDPHHFEEDYRIEVTKKEDKRGEG